MTLMLNMATPKGEIAPISDSPGFSFPPSYAKLIPPFPEFLKKVKVVVKKVRYGLLSILMIVKP